MKRLAACLFRFFWLSPRRCRADDTLFDDMGGQPGIDKLVDASVDNYLADPRIKDDLLGIQYRPHPRRAEGSVLPWSRAAPAAIPAIRWRPRTRACI